MAADNGKYKNIVLAMLFAAGRPLKLEEIAANSGISSVGFIKQIANELEEEYKNSDSPFEISHFDDSYELILKEEYAKLTSGVAGKPEISKGALKVLAYISKNEPVMQKDIIKAFGESAYQHIKEIVEKEFITAKKEGRTKRLETTQKFKEYFNITS